jgi:hypothetical protein
MKKPRDAGLFETGLQIYSGASGLVAHGFESCPRLAALAQDLGSHFLARPTPGGNAQFTLQLPQILNTGLGSLSNLLIGYRVADANVHDFSVFLSVASIQTQMRMIVNSIKYKPRQGS